MNYARRRALQSTCPTSTEQQQLYRALASVMTAVISSAPSHMSAEAVGRRAVVFDSRPGKRLLADGGEGTGPGKDHHSPPIMRLMETALRGLVRSKCLVYLDDVIVFGKTAEGHRARLREVLRRLREVGLKVKPKKCRLIKRKVAYSGHIISEKGIATNPCKTCAVTPTCVTELRQFLGLASYYRKFVNGFANIAAPLHRLLEKGAEWDWSKACQSAFDALKYHLTSAPILAYPEFHRRFTVDVDVRGDGIGAVLSQREGKTERVVAYASRTLTKAARRYCATQKEMLSLVWALREFRPYLYGQRFLVRTDHSCLRWLRNFKEPEGQVV
ncbi:Retrovirus-related Pol polyprotein from transposon [Trichinella sp. T8]|nr:Retrovirus-related Pol polyprotein from transposon [Trichinella sp. T8]